MGPRSEIETVDLPADVQVHWCPDGDHSLAPRKRSGLSLLDNLSRALDRMAGFAEQHIS
jgi:predicted alpha/beta-hydrolase family hydrolase